MIAGEVRFGACRNRRWNDLYKNDKELGTKSPKSVEQIEDTLCRQRGGGQMRLREESLVVGAQKWALIPTSTRLPASAW
jgi:hypothetical protein